MESFNKEARLLAAKLTEELFMDKVDFDVYLMEFPEEDSDEVLSELYDLIEHEQPEAAFGGESKLKNHSEMKKYTTLLIIFILFFSVDTYSQNTKDSIITVKNYSKYIGLSCILREDLN